MTVSRETAFLAGDRASAKALRQQEEVSKGESGGQRGAERGTLGCFKSRWMPLEGWRGNLAWVKRVTRACLGDQWEGHLIEALCLQSTCPASLLFLSFTN